MIDSSFEIDPNLRELANRLLNAAQKRFGLSLHKIVARSWPGDKQLTHCIYWRGGNWKIDKTITMEEPVANYDLIVQLRCVSGELYQTRSFLTAECVDYAIFDPTEEIVNSIEWPINRNE